MHNQALTATSRLASSLGSSRFGRFRTATVVVTGLLAMLTWLSPPIGTAYASGQKNASRTSSSGTAPLTLTSESVYWNPQASGVSCLTEDDSDRRVFSGSLSGSYSTTYHLCDQNKDGVTAGGIGLQSDVSVVGQLADLTITAPDGTAHQAVLMSQSTSKGVTTSFYETCYVPLFYESSNTGTDPLPGGAWQITLSGQIQNASWTTRAEMAYVNFQQNYCPSSEQNLAP